MTLGTWFQDLARCARDNPDPYLRLGFADLRLQVEATDPDGATRSYGFVLDGYEVTYAGEVDDPGAFRADAVISGPTDVWQEIAANVRQHGHADRYHTLNAVTIADAPLRVSSTDPMGRDKFFRYAETLQTFFDGSGKSLATID